MELSNEIRRRAGRPRLGKKKVMLCLDPAVIAGTDKLAKAERLGRSAYVEAILRSALLRKRVLSRK